MTETEIQNMIFRYYHQDRSNKIIPNVKLYDYEADLLRITKAGFLHEYEIKLTKSDYKADFKKSKKHKR